MADWKKLATAALMADGKIDDTEVKILKKELFADKVIDDEEMQFLTELRTAATKKAKAAKEEVNPKFEKLYYEAVETHVTKEGKVDTAKLETLLGKPDDNKKKFLTQMKKKAKEVSPEFTTLLEKYGVK